MQVRLQLKINQFQYKLNSLDLQKWDHTFFLKIEYSVPNDRINMKTNIQDRKFSEKAEKSIYKVLERKRREGEESVPCPIDVFRTYFGHWRVFITSLRLTQDLVFRRSNKASSHLCLLSYMRRFVARFSDNYSISDQK